MNQLALSNDLTVITAEINSFKQVAGQAVFEIGKRLKHVKENDLVHGEWLPFLETVDISSRTAQAMVQAFERFGNAQSTALLPTGKIFEMLSLPKSIDTEIFVETPHVIPSTGEEKKVSDMTQLQLREVTKQLKQVESERLRLENQTITLQQELNLEKTKPVLEVVPDEIKQKLDQQQQEVERLRNSLESTEKQLKTSQSQLKEFQHDAEQHQKLKREILDLNTKKDDLNRQIESAVSLARLSVQIEEMLRTQLAPIRYSRALTEQRNSKAAMQNLGEIVELVEGWCAEIRSLMPKEYIEVEVIK